ncbi:MOSC domain-containing protein [Mycena sanguinolenta]|uniref:MOSC domain-containing protein n=1 Tax=Mycena sanguinolenta TaxID=230812 RepID=A0A8H7CT85_9AGAR|nr:MOSC domain-containing protein [Mycena sanguinolenta]
MIGIDGLESVIPIRPLLLLSIGFASLYVVTRTTSKLRLFSPSQKPVDTVHGTDIKISRILVYPIKSCAGTDLQTSAYDQEGFEFDRKWMIVDLEKNKQLSARDNRGIKLVRVFPLIKRDPSSPTGGVLEVTFPDSPDTPSFSIPLNPTEEQLSTWDVHAGFDLWGWSTEGYIVESADPGALETPSEILSEYVGRPVLLVMNTPTPRPITEPMPFDPARLAYEGGPSVRYPDFSPFLIVSNASLEDAEAKVWAMARGEFEQKVAGCKPDDPAPPLNDWARKDAKKLLMERFRPNVVVSGVNEPFGEDDWQEIVTLDNRTFVLPARCPRCMFPNVDTESGLRDSQMPNNAMMQYRKVEAFAPSKYCFGMYMIPAESSGVLSVGDQILVTRSAVNPKLTDA